MRILRTPSRATGAFTRRPQPGLPPAVSRRLGDGGIDNVAHQPRPFCCFEAKGAAGFTLLELLVSLTIVSLLATMVLFGWRIASSAWEKANSRLEQHRTVLATHHLLQEQMASMAPYQARTRRGAREFFFQGESHTARFLSRYSLLRRSRSGLYRIEYLVQEQTGGTRQLLLNEFPVKSEEELGTLVAGAEMYPAGRILKFLPLRLGPQTVVLLEGLKECRLEYYRPPRGTAPGSWTAQWTTSNRELPRGMAIRAVASAESGELQPVSIVAAIRNFSLRSGR